MNVNPGFAAQAGYRTIFRVVGIVCMGTALGRSRFCSCGASLG